MTAPQSDADLAERVATLETALRDMRRQMAEWAPVAGKSGNVENLLKGLGRQHGELSLRTSEHYFAENALHLTALSLLISHDVVSVDDVERTAAAICGNPGMHASYREPNVQAWIKFVIDLLRHVHDRKSAAPTWTPRVIIGGATEPASGSMGENPESTAC